MLGCVKLDVGYWGISQRRMVNKSTNGMNHLQNNIADNQVRAGEGGAIEVILDVMRTHISNSMVCGAGCKALGNITVNGKQIETQME